MENNKRPLLGDRVEEALKKIGGDKAAKLIEKVTKKPCGCQKRKEMLNTFHRQVRSTLHITQDE